MITSANPEPGKAAAALRDELQPVIQRHLRFGWWSLVVFLSLGLLLEGFHGFKAAFYLDVSNHTRRLMWTLAHAHGTLLGLVQIAFAATLSHAPMRNIRQRALASVCFIAAGILMPAGFFLGGVVVHAGDPGLGILLVPIGGLLLLMAGGLTIHALRPVPASLSPRAWICPKKPPAKTR